MDEVIWIRSVDYDPAVKVGSRVQPEEAFPFFEVLDRRPVVMLFKDGAAWDMKPFTQLTLKMVARGTTEPTEPESFVLVGPSGQLPS